MWGKARIVEPETMDQPDLKESDLLPALRAIRRVNQLSRTASVLWPHIAQLAAEKQRPITLLDVATASGDVPLALARRARREGVELTAEGIDINPHSLKLGQVDADAEKLPVRFFRHDVLSAPPPGRYDVVTCCLFLHHQSEAHAAALLRELAEICELLLVDDLERSFPGYLAALAGTRLLSRSRIAQQDGARSVKAAFRRQELLVLAEAAGLTGCTLKQHWPFRQLLVWRKQQQTP